MGPISKKLSIILLCSFVCILYAIIIGMTSLDYLFKQKKIILLLSNPNKVYQISFSADKEVFQLFPTLLNSIYKNLQEYEKANVHIITMPDINEKDIKILQSFSINKFDKKITLLFYPFNYKLKYTRTLKHVSEATMCRLLLPNIIDKSIDKLLYLDTDVVVNTPLRELFGININSQCGIVARSSTKADLINDWLKKDKIYPHIIYNGTKSFNAGILLISLNKLRRNHFTDKAMEFVEKWGLNDQIILNLYCNGEYDELPMQYNFWAGRDDYRNTSAHGIVHFAGPNKPWQPNYQPYEEQLLWYKYSLKYPTGEEVPPPEPPIYLTILSTAIENLKFSELKNLTCRCMITVVSLDKKNNLKLKNESEISDLWIDYKVIKNKEMNMDKENSISYALLIILPGTLSPSIKGTFFTLETTPSTDICNSSRNIKYNKESSVCSRVSGNIFYLNLEKLRDTHDSLLQDITEIEPKILFGNICT
ncbi:glycosyl transferase family 8 protein [Cryptosporidium andersoni]|uniref:Glycosyl transferase family 8 protein n=1 Tax=Cryptosporidium andersoni TaxID=117008 RepID=A0A1J4MU57_9CRYT|nr:glycosyl transferase family 8 protein [Cryptosporidium andersoni]